MLTSVCSQLLEPNILSARAQQLETQGNLQGNTGGTAVVLFCAKGNTLTQNKEKTKTVRQPKGGNGKDDGNADREVPSKDKRFFRRNWRGKGKPKEKTFENRKPEKAERAEKRTNPRPDQADMSQTFCAAADWDIDTIDEEPSKN